MIHQIRNFLRTSCSGLMSAGRQLLPNSASRATYAFFSKMFESKFWIFEKFTEKFLMSHHQNLKSWYIGSLDCEREQARTFVARQARAIWDEIVKWTRLPKMHPGLDTLLPSHHHATTLLVQGQPHLVLFFVKGTQIQQAHGPNRIHDVRQKNDIHHEDETTKNKAHTPPKFPLVTATPRPIVRRIAWCLSCSSRILT